MRFGRIRKLSPALPLLMLAVAAGARFGYAQQNALPLRLTMQDRKSTRLNSSHIQKSRMPSSA